MVISINLGIEFCKPRYAKDCWVIKLRNHMKFNSYWSGARYKLYKNNGNLRGDNTRFIIKFDL